VHAVINFAYGAPVHVPTQTSNLQITGTCYMSSVTLGISTLNSNVSVPCVAGTWSYTLPSPNYANGWAVQSPFVFGIALWDGGIGHPRDDYKLVDVYTP
jgi:hypothetical protein